MLQAKIKRAVLFLLAISLSLIPCKAAFAQDEAAPPSLTTPMRPETMEAYSNRQVHPFDSAKVQNQFDIIGFELAAKNEYAELYVNKRFHTIRLRDVKTSYVWGAQNIDAAEGLNKSWLSYGNSIAGIECFDADGIEKRYGLSENAQASYTMTENGFICSLSFDALGIAFDVQVSLNANGLTFFVDEQGIQENGDFKLKSIMFMPYMGSVYSNSINGYILVPDGSGALIRFQKPLSYTSGFAKKVYGKDLAIDVLSDASDLKTFRPNDYLIQDPQILMPVYGIVHGDEQNAFLGVINSGAEYASIIANPAAPNNPYNWGGVRFEFRQKYNLSTNRKEGSGTIVPQEVRNRLSPSLTLHFLSGSDASYDKMAVFYRELLFGEYNDRAVKGDIPLKLEVLGATSKNNFFKTVQLLSSLNDAQEIIKELNKNEIVNINLVLRGFTKNNEAGLAIQGSLGGKKELSVLQQYMSENGGRLYFHLDPLSVNKDQINLRTEAANNLSNVVINIKRNNSSVMYADNYFYRLSEAEKRINKTLSAIGNVPFAIDSLGYRLYGDYTTNMQFTRAENMAITSQLAQKTSRNEKTPFYQPNSYLWNNVSEFYDTPLVSSQYLFETDTVPFLQIVLSGKIDMFSQPLNTGTYSDTRLLRMVEYGVYPAFTVTAAESEKLYNTPYEDYFSTNFSDWSTSIKDSYSFIGQALSAVNGQQIIEHNAIDNGFVSTKYTGNKTIYINYTDEVKAYGSIIVQPYSYFVSEGEGGRS